MVYPPCPCCTERAEYCSQHALKLETLRLFAALLLDKIDDGQPNSSPSSALAKCPPNLVEALQMIPVEVRAAAEKTFEQFLFGSSGPPSVSNFVSISEPSYDISGRTIVYQQIFLAFRENFVRSSLRKTLTTPLSKFCRS